MTSNKPQFRSATLLAPGGAARALDRLLRDAHPGASWADVRRLVTTGKVSVNGGPVRDPALRVPAGAQIELDMQAHKPRLGPALPRGAIQHVDADLVVVNKPAGISTVPFDEHERGTLDELVRAELGRREAPLGIVHRIDKETSGLVVFARTLAAKRALKQQFRVHSVFRRYQAIASGRVEALTLRTRLVKDRGDGRRGSVNNPKLGRVAVTHLVPLERFATATLVECRLETGRTHQIRIHLAEAGHPLLGERVYADKALRERLAAPRLMLHACELGFRHPRTEAELRFTEPLPEDMRRVLAALRVSAHETPSTSKARSSAR